MKVDEVSEVVPVHLEAFAGYMNSRLGVKYVRSFISWFCRAERSIALVAVDETGKVAGYVLGAPVGYDRKLNRDLLWVAAAGLLGHPWLLLRRQIRRAILRRLKVLVGDVHNIASRPKLPEPTMSLVGIGVASSAQGTGIGFHLVRAFEHRAQQLGMRSVLLSVYASNATARRLYARCGWQQGLEPSRPSDLMFYSQILHED